MTPTDVHPSGGVSEQRVSERAQIRIKIAGDSLWNFGAYGWMAATGAVINVFVAGWRSGEALGVFNQVYAIYVVFAQLATVGVHDSAQKHAAEHAEDRTQLAALTRTALSVSAAAGALVALLLALLAPVIGSLTASDAVERGVVLVAPGLLLFVVNKSLLGVLNGQRRMRAFALVQSARVLVILVTVVLVGTSTLPDWALVSGFTAAELTIFPVLLWLLRAQLGASPAALRRRWRRRHLRFGLRALPNGLLAESFIRVDIIMLGLFLSDAEVGVYSFAALFVEGLYQVAVVLRTVANPVLVRLVTAGDKAKLAGFCRRTGTVSLALSVGVAAVVYLSFPVLGHWLNGELVTRSRDLLQILFVGLCAYAAFVPSDYLLLQAGLPGKQSVLMTANVAVNVTANALLIPRLGIVGAAFATAGAYAASAVALNLAAARWLGMNRTIFGSPRRKS